MRFLSLFMIGISIGLIIEAIINMENTTKLIMFMSLAIFSSFSALMISKHQSNKIVSKFYETSYLVKERPDNCPRCKNPYIISGGMFYSCSRCGFSSIKGVKK